MDRATIDTVELAYEVRGTGEPVLLVHGAHIADSLRPLMAEPVLGPFRCARYHRRGLGDSTRPPGAEPTSMDRQVADAVGMLDHLLMDQAHLVGHSLGAAIALLVAARHPTRVHSLTLIEPPPPFSGDVGPAAAEFFGAVAPLMERYQGGDVEGAVGGFLALVGGDDWRASIEAAVPGGVAQAVNDASTFFETELPASADWAFGPQDAAAVTCPVLSVTGTASGPMFAESHELLHSWFPQCENADIALGTHLLPIEAPSALAAIISQFASSH